MQNLWNVSVKRNCIFACGKEDQGLRKRAEQEHVFAAVSTIVNGHAKKETDMTVHLAGGDLIIRWKDNDHVLMTGPAETICDGTFYL